MENTKIIFESTSLDGQEMQVYKNVNNEIFIKIYEDHSPEIINFVTLNKATACKLSKILKREISKIENNDR